MIYNFNSLPQWNAQYQPAQPQVRNDLGYDILATKLGPARRAAAYKRANARIGDNQFWWPLFITDVTIDIALAGSTAQSRETRDFYPRNFVQPNFIISGIAIDQQDYGMMLDFIHHMQQRMLENPKQLLSQLEINGHGLPFGTRTTGLHVTFRAAKYLGLNSYSLVNQTLKGQHDSILCQGWVGTAQREHTQGVYTPQYDIQYIVADMIHGPYSEQLVTATQQANWTTMLKSTSNITNDPALIAEAKKAVAKAQQSWPNIISNPPPPSSGSSSTGGGNITPPASSSETDWIKSLLSGLGAPATQANINSISSWIAHECAWNDQPPDGAQYTWNPLNTTQDAPGAVSLNSAGVKKYPSETVGLQATVTVMQNGYYNNIVKALRAGTGVCGSGFESDFKTWSGSYTSVC